MEDSSQRSDSMSSRGPLKLLNVQVLRAYGALAVVFFHTDFSVGIGHIGSFGVSIFFVISGFVMARICDLDSRHFLARRVARIVPLYWLLTFCVFAIARVAPSWLGSGNATDPVSLLKSLFFIPYMNHGLNHQGYFPLLFLGWTLNYEMYFYLLIAAALLINKRHAALIACAGIIAVFAVLRLSHLQGAILFYAHPLVFHFIFGVLCYYGFRYASPQRILDYRGWLSAAAFAAAVGMIAAAITTGGTLYAALIMATSTVLVFCAVLLDKVDYSLRWTFLILLGDASYVIYLIHPYCEGAFNKIVAHRFPVLNTSTPFGMPLVIGVTIAVSIAVYRLIDNPMHRAFRKLLSPNSRLAATDANPLPGIQTAAPHDRP